MADKKPTMMELNMELHTMAYEMLHAVSDEEREERRAKLLALLASMDDKAEAYLSVMDRHVIEIDACKRAVESHTARIKRMERSMEFLRTTLQSTLELQYETQGVERLTTAEGRWIRFYPDATKTVLNITEDVLPEEWWKMTRAPRKQDIRNAMKDGEEIPGADLEVIANPHIRWEK